MKKLAYISLLALATLSWSCQRFEDEIDNYNLEQDNSSVVVTRLEDGRLQVTASIGSSSMNEVDVSSRASDSFESVINGGYCLIFGEDATEMADAKTATYTDDSPLLMKLPIERDANNQFTITFVPYAETAFLRILVNLTEREEEYLENIVAWGDSADNYETITDPETQVSTVWLSSITASDMSGVGTFGQYKLQSVGLDGVYDFEYSTTVTTDTELDANGLVDNLVYSNINTTVQPDPTKLSSGIPMSSIGFALEDGITEDTLSDIFGTMIYMVPVCSKVDVAVSDSAFELYEVCLIDCPQESRWRSTVLSGAFDEDQYTSALYSSSFSLPTDLGGTITYKSLVEDSPVTSGGTSSPIYFYPNWGGNYDDNGGEVNQGVNPQYVIIKGRAGGYDSDGYYKIALKAQYPLSYTYVDDDKTIIEDVATWSDVTYDILRSTHFKIDLLGVDKPGYKTFDDARDPNNAASNISYNITIWADDGRNEVLVSNGTYFVELETSRVYAKGYFATGFEGDIEFTITPDTGNSFPQIYIQANDFSNDSNDEVSITGCWSSTDTSITDWTGDGITSYDLEENNTGDGFSNYMVVIPASDEPTKVKVAYKATGSGRLRLRIGDILKFIPVMYEEGAVSYEQIQLSIKDEADFSYTGIEVESGYNNILSDKGVVEENPSDEENREMRAKLYMDDGVTKLYIVQSLVTGPGDYSMMDPSNCYIINDISEEEGDDTVYYIPIYDRINDFWRNYAGESTKLGDLDGIEGGLDLWYYEVIWYDNSSNPFNESNDTSKRVYIDKAIINGKYCLKVTRPNDFDNMGNIIVAVKDATDNTLLWSWHLWLTDYNPDAIAAANVAGGYGEYTEENYIGAVHRYEGTLWESGGVYADKFIMDRNLGYRDANEYISGGGAGALYYQFGRKDPFPINGKTYLNGYELDHDDLSASNYEGVSIATSVQNPTTWYAGKISSSSTDAINWCNLRNTYNCFWNDVQSILDSTSPNYNEKSLFDPSPYGWMVPIDGVWSDFTTDTFVDYDESSTLFHFCYRGFAYYYSMGYRSNSGSTYGAYGTAGYWWSATPQVGSDYSAMHLHYYGNTDPAKTYIDEYSSVAVSRSGGYSVRAIQQ